MANRLSTITTRTGDDGTTGLGDGSRVSKTDARICAMGDIDELNSAIGVLLAEPMPRSIHDRLIDIQHDLFDIGGELSIPGYALLPMSRVEALDAEIEAWNQHLPRLQEFILPGGCRASALAHICRTVARRAERSLIHLRAGAPIRDEIGYYLNRLSDLLFYFGPHTKPLCRMRRTWSRRTLEARSIRRYPLVPDDAHERSSQGFQVFVGSDPNRCSHP